MENPEREKRKPCVRSEFAFVFGLMGRKKGDEIRINLYKGGNLQLGKQPPEIFVFGGLNYCGVSFFVFRAKVELSCVSFKSCGLKGHFSIKCII